MDRSSTPNRLDGETSLYLLQHANNPVDWYPWGDEALNRAKAEDKLILLSIGYSACHWCHVMAHESFENAEIADFMNKNFVNIKVDREERPDLDSIYMQAVQALTGSGGWPLTVFLTPDGKPFFGGTYFPPEDRRGMPGFNRILKTVADAYKNIDVYRKGSFGIYPTLICECKNNPQPIVFFVQEEAFEPLIDEVRVSGIPSKVWQRNKYISVQEFTKVASFHHYCKPDVPVATQCCTFEMKKGTSFWMASHGEELYETFRTLAKALEQEVDDDFRNMNQWFVPKQMEKEFVDLSFYYPVVIFQGDIHAAYIGENNLPEKNDLTLKKCDHVQYNPEFFSFYDNEVISYHIDVISEKYLPSYLAIIEREMLTIKQILEQEKRSVMLSIGKIAAECMGLETKPTTYRKHLEYQF